MVWGWGPGELRMGVGGKERMGARSVGRGRFGAPRWGGGGKEGTGLPQRGPLLLTYTQVQGLRPSSASHARCPAWHARAHSVRALPLPGPSPPCTVLPRATARAPRPGRMHPNPPPTSVHARCPPLPPPPPHATPTCCTYPIFRLTAFVSGWPLKVMEPVLRRRLRPASSARSVDLPEPEGPISAAGRDGMGWLGEGVGSQEGGTGCLFSAGGVCNRACRGCFGYGATKSPAPWYCITTLNATQGTARQASPPPGQSAWHPRGRPATTCRLPRTGL